MSDEVSLRIRVVELPKGVVFRMQRGKNELVEPVTETADELVFEFTLRTGKRLKDGSPSLLGPFAQGPPDRRFVYVNSGTLAGQADSPWTRRAKVHLEGISDRMIEQVQRSPDRILEARIFGLSSDGGPCCATVPLLEDEWKVQKR